MGEQAVASLGRALTVLGLEDKFLSNGELSHFPLVERGRITTDIISEKLKRGSWLEVVQMMYGGLGKASALYEGDRDQLREDILQSAVSHPQDLESDYKGKILEILSKEGESDLLFRMATSIPSLNLNGFLTITNYINDDYLTDNPEKRQILRQLKGDKAFEEEKYEEALGYFRRSKSVEGISKIFNILIEQDYSSSFSGSSLDLLISTALSDPAHSSERLKQIITNPKFDSQKSFKLYRENPNIKLNKKELSNLHERVAVNASGWEIGKGIYEDTKLVLLWAKKHAKSEPKRSYHVFKQKSYNGKEVEVAVISGLELGWEANNQERRLSVEEIDEKYLKKVYGKVPFKVKVDIALHLKDKKRLNKLSLEANKQRKLNDAYRLWISSEGDQLAPYITEIRSKLIEDGIKNHGGSMSFLERSDHIGTIKAYEALVESKAGERENNLIHAHKLALRIGNETMTQRVRQLMLNIGPRFALGNFIGYSGEVKDEIGIDYVLSTVAESQGVEKDQLRKFLEKYRKN